MQVQSAAIRAVVLGAYQTLCRAIVWYPPPRVFVNSLPKAGTHLVRRLLDHFPNMRFSGVHLITRAYLLDDRPWVPIGEMRFDYDRLRRDLHRIPDGQVVTGHLPARPELPVLFRELGYQMVFVARDARDVVASNAKYMAALRRHYFYEHFRRYEGHAVRTVIDGVPPGSDGIGLDGIGALLREFRGWLRTESVHVARFEELVGPRGGGSREAQMAAIESLARHVGRDLDAERLEKTADALWSRHSATFRKGQAGDWQNHFSSADVAAFRAAVDANELALWGYDSSGVET